MNSFDCSSLLCAHVWRVSLVSPSVQTQKFRQDLDSTTGPSNHKRCEGYRTRKLFLALLREWGQTVPVSSRVSRRWWGACETVSGGQKTAVLESHAKKGTTKSRPAHHKIHRVVDVHRFLCFASAVTRRMAPAGQRARSSDCGLQILLMVEAVPPINVTPGCLKYGSRFASLQADVSLRRGLHDHRKPFVSLGS